VPNTDVRPLLPWTFGWSYGLPVLVCLVAVVAVAWVAMHRDAVRPFARPEAVTAESRERAATASAVLGLVAAGALLAVGGAFRLIASASIGGVSIGGGPDAGSYVTAMAPFTGTVMRVLGGAAEITAFTVLLLLAARSFSAVWAARAAQLSDPAAVR
jgi:hypothetical protein